MDDFAGLLAARAKHGQDYQPGPIPNLIVGSLLRGRPHEGGASSRTRRQGRACAFGALRRLVDSFRTRGL
ncbi:MAG: hypothetical protein ACREDJ_06445, partial [Methylocella sp.]